MNAKPSNNQPDELLRLLEAVLFAASEPLDLNALKNQLPQRADVPSLLNSLQNLYAPRGVNLVCIAKKWSFRTAQDLRFILSKQLSQTKRLSRAAMETLAVVAYHQPVTRTEIESVRGVRLSQGSLDALMEAGWVRITGRRQSPGKPLNYATTDAFLQSFGFDSLENLPDVAELKAAGLLNLQPPAQLNPQQPQNLHQPQNPHDETPDAEAPPAA